MDVPAVPLRLWLLVFALAAGAGCGGSPLSPSEVAEFEALTTTTNTFSGTLGAGGTMAHPFVGAKGGNVTLTLTAIGPDSATLLSLGLGLWDGTACTIQISTSAGKLNEVYQATTASAGNYCVLVADPGTFAAAVTYTVRVTHP